MMRGDTLSEQRRGMRTQLGPDSEKTLEVTFSLEATWGVIRATGMSAGEKIGRLRALVERMVGVLGEENVVTLSTLNDFGMRLQENREYEEARKVHDRCLAGREKVLGVDHMDTLATVHNLGAIYYSLKDYEKALKYYERALKGKEKMLGKTHPETLGTVMNIASAYIAGFKDYGKAEELYQRVLEGNEAQLGKDHEGTKKCAMGLAVCFAKTGEKLKLRKIISKYPHILIDGPPLKEYL